MDYLTDYLSKTIWILREAKAQFKNTGVLWSMGKDSTAMLHLIKKAFGEVPFKVIHIDNGNEFEECYEFKKHMQQKLSLDIITKKSIIREDEISGLSCCGANKTDALKEVIKEHKFDSIIVSIRWDEHGIRGLERYFSARDKEFKWNFYNPDKGEYGEALQDAEFIDWGITVSDFGKNCDHVRIHPLLHWREIDVWKFIQQENIPVNPLYFSRNGRRFRSLGCKSCTVAVDSTASSVDDIIQELTTTQVRERAGRAESKENTYIMQRLRALGYM